MKQAFGGRFFRIFLANSGYAVQGRLLCVWIRCLTLGEFADRRDDPSIMNMRPVFSTPVLSGTEGFSGANKLYHTTSSSG